MTVSQHLKCKQPLKAEETEINNGVSESGASQAGSTNPVKGEIIVEGRHCSHTAFQHFPCRLAGGSCLWKPLVGVAFPMSQLSFLCEITYPSISFGI